MLKFFTDSDCDVTLKQAKEYGVELISMPYEMKGTLIYPYKDWEEFNGHEFYDILRKGTLPSTSALNMEEYYQIFEPVFKNGDDVLYVHFSRAMTVTFDQMDKVIKDLLEKYPGRKFYEIDCKGITICAFSVVLDAMEMYKAGKTAEEIVEWGKTAVDHSTTYFFADDLKFFRKSGRVSGFSGIMGNIIGIKPILTMNDEGKMSTVGKVRGTKKALETLVEYFDKLKTEDYKQQRIIIGHGDDLELAQKLGAMLTEKYGDLNIMYTFVNPTAGSHCGPETIGINFKGIHR